MRIRLPHKRFTLMRHNLLTNVMYPIATYWFRWTAERARLRESTDEPRVAYKVVP
jgi:hypothetical protein